MSISLSVWSPCPISNAFLHVNSLSPSRRGMGLHTSSSVGLDDGDRTISSSSTSISASASSMIDQKNVILLEKFQSAPEGNCTAMAQQYANFCDESFDKYLNEKIANTEEEAEKQKLGKVRYEINVARQMKLKAADNLLREILAAGGTSRDFQLKQMEAKLRKHMNQADIDMAFMVI